MTFAPAPLLAARSYIIDVFGVAPAAVGIVGDPAHRGGYHCGSDRTVSGDYSVVESSRDRNGLSGASAGLDVGTFTKGDKNLRTFSAWLVAECKRGAPDTKDIREVIYSLDGKTVKRWDRLGRRTSGDSSHLWHTHISFFRDSETRDKTAVFRRYIEGGEPDMGDLIGLSKGDKGQNVKGLQYTLRRAGFDPEPGKEPDGVYGAKTAAALAKCRKAMGSSDPDGNSVTGAGYSQLLVALTRAEIAKAVTGGGSAPAGKYRFTGTGTLTAE